MKANSYKGRRERASLFAELAIGVGLLAKGWDGMEQAAHLSFRVLFIFLAGFLVIIGAALHQRFAGQKKNFAELFHVLEGLVEITCASLLLERGKHWIPVFLAFIGLFYISRGLTQFLTKEHDREKNLVRFRTVQGIVFIAFGAAAAVVNALTDHKIEVYGVAAILVAGGLIALLRRKSQQNIKIGLWNRARS